MRFWCAVPVAVAVVVDNCPSKSHGKDESWLSLKFRDTLEMQRAEKDLGLACLPTASSG